MGDNVKPTYAKSDVKSGLVNEQYAEKVLDGVPTKKHVDEVFEANQVKNAPGSVMIKSYGAATD
jgi:hypothetical protein